MSATITPLPARFGARIEGLDLDQPSPELGAELTTLLAEHQLLFFDGSAIDDEGQAALLTLLGEPYIHPLARMAGATTATASHIVDDADHPPYQDQWHTDVSWDPEPPVIGSLRCIEMPERGGNTIWADTCAAYDRVSAPMQAWIETLTATHDMGRGHAFEDKAGVELTAKTREAFPGVSSPVVATHPVSGRKYLNVNAGFTRSIDGLRPEESAMVLRQLFAIVADPSLQYRHQWTEGELCLWDERTTQHNAVADHYPARREMARFTIR
ncbi:MAG: taurine dioxygenase [Acidimicrobiales bacterium]|nr:taurine dioxygenase [Acidimicrobiales bacterium]